MTVKGLDKFKAQFEPYKDSYVIIGGTACYVHMQELGVDFRTTKDVDMVILTEEASSDFYKVFWNFIINGKYEHINKASGESQYYRFTNPGAQGYPYMIEIFSKKDENIELPESAIITPILLDDYISDLSAIILDPSYYQVLMDGIELVDSLSVLSVGHLILFKIKAFLDLEERSKNDSKVDSKNIKKHRNDVLRLGQLLTGNEKIGVSKDIRKDIESFIVIIEKANLPLKDLKIDLSKEEIINLLGEIYIII